MILHTYHPYPILGHIGSLTIHWYGLFLALGALGGYVIFRRLGALHRLKSADLENTFFLMVVFGIIGARLYHVLNEWTYYRLHPQEIIAIWNGGLAIHGAIIAGFATLLIYAAKKKISIWRFLDCAVPALAFGQAVGRWGNYFNQELFGRETSLPWGIPIDVLNRPIEMINSSYFHPTFLYESIGSFIIFALLFWLSVRQARHPRPASFWHSTGTLTVLYFVLFPINRIISELFRVDRVPMIGNVRLPILVSIVILAIALAVLAKHRNSKTA